MGVSIVNNEVSLAEVSSLEDFFTAKLDCKYSVSAPFKSIPDDCDFYYLNELAKEDRKDAFIKKYKRAQDFMCLFVVVPEGANFVFYPYK